VRHESEPHALLVDRDSTIYWRAAGPKTPDCAAHLREVVHLLT
jgi:hypothetical protein